MLVGVAVVGLAGAALAALLWRRLGWLSSLAIAGFLASVAVLGLITLLPATGAPGWIPAEEAQTACSRDIGGPAPDGFWVFGGGQRLLNVAVFVPSGMLLVLAVARWRVGWLLAPLGLLALAAYSVTIELTQLELARLDRACDVTDMIDNTTGAAIGFALGVLLAALLRPWRHRHRVDAPA